MTNIGEFLAEFSATDEFERWTQDHSTFDVFLARIHELATLSDEFAGSVSSQFIWNLQYAVGELLWDQHIAEPDRLNLLHDVCIFVAAIGRSENPAAGQRSPSLHQFWESVVEVGDRPANADNDVIASALFDCLTKQLDVRNSLVQLMALHGLNHLRDPRTPR